MAKELGNEQVFMYNGDLVAKLLPSGLTPFTHQIGGLNPTKPLKDKFLFDASNGTIYKVLSTQLKGFNEACFYAEVFASEKADDPLITRLKAFLPAYRGLFHQPNTGRFLVAMGDMQWGMEQPNAMDVKLGRYSYGPYSSPGKMAIEQAKYPWRGELGFFITGIRVTGMFFDRLHGQSLTPSTVYENGICLFLDGKNGKEDAVSRRSTLARAFAERLQKLIDWFEEQCLHRFVASSLFFCYDWSTPRSDADLILGDSRFIRLHLIDFARWFKVSDTDATASKDENCLHGLYNLRNYFRVACSERLDDKTAGSISFTSGK